ncbi:hypothetical protein OG949_39420 [Streptomyces scopuliridis]|uniref:Mu transposase domain-containing protein n=1 Tax=Streptomyces scopuliridis TaxID=452529 RepID=UPI002DD9394D|nr:hypothetical protein [Streptomyces scopuliridis]WSB38297.1 hypothetical protein OG949_39420 [Streptomyces scopuliridis]
MPAKRKKPPPRASVLDPVKSFTDAMPRADLEAPRMQRHTIERIPGRPAGEHDFELAAYSMVRDYVHRSRPQLELEAKEGRRLLEGTVPQEKRPGEEAELDFADVWLDLTGQRRKCVLFTLRMSYSGKAVHRVYATASQEAFEALGGVPTVHERLAAIDTAEDARHVHRRPTSIGFDFEQERELLGALPADGYDCGIDLTPVVHRNGRITVRQCSYSVPGKFIGATVRVKLRANELWSYDGRRVVASHPRLTRRYTFHDILDHYLEILLATPGAFAGASASASASASAPAQARAEGGFTRTHEAFWAAAKRKAGDIEARKAMENAGINADEPAVAGGDDEWDGPGEEEVSGERAKVISLHKRRLPPDPRTALPDMSTYDRLLTPVKDPRTTKQKGTCA